MAFISSKKLKTSFDTETDPSTFVQALDDLWFDRIAIQKSVSQIPSHHWYLFDCGKTRWTVQESYSTRRMECAYFPKESPLLQLYQLFDPPINFGDLILTRTPPPGIPPHVDRNRSAAINFPISGSFFNSPIQWFETFSKESEVHRFYHSQVSAITKELTPLLFDPKKIHGVLNLDDHDRCLLSVWWRNHSFDEIRDRWSNGSLIKKHESLQNPILSLLR